MYVDCITYFKIQMPSEAITRAMCVTRFNRKIQKDLELLKKIDQIDLIHNTV